MNQTSPLREARSAKGMSLSALAQTIKTDIGHLSRIERGEAAASPALAENIVEAIGLDLIHEMQILYPERFKAKKIGKVNKAPPLRLKVGEFLYALIGAA